MNDKQKAIAWAQGILSKPESVAILDTETTGLYNPEVLELAIIDATGKILYNGKFKPVLKIEAGAARVHRLTAEQLATEPSWESEWDSIQSLLLYKTVVIYNAGYDTNAISNTCKLHHVEPHTIPRVNCAMLWYAQFVGERRYGNEYKWQKLPHYHDLHMHSALGDAQATLRTIQLMAKGG